MMESPRVLIIEENRRTVGELHDRLQAKGFEAEVALSGDMGLEIVDERGMDAVIVDHRITGFPEWELVRRLHTKAPEIPLVLINGPRQRGVSRLARQAGATRFMRSPVNADRVISVVETVLDT